MLGKAMWEQVADWTVIFEGYLRGHLMGNFITGIKSAVAAAGTAIAMHRNRGYMKAGSCILLIQLPSGLSVGLSRKACSMSSGHGLVVWTPWLTPGNKKKKLLLSVCAASMPSAGGVLGS